MSSLDLAFIGGNARAAFASREAAVAAAREAVAQDEKHRPRAVWFARGATRMGFCVPDRWIAGLARRPYPMELGEPAEVIK